MIKDVVDPLFDAIPKDIKNSFPKKNYLDQKDLLDLKERFSTLTIVNHSTSHGNLGTLTDVQLKVDLEECQEFLKNANLSSYQFIQ